VPELSSVLYTTHDQFLQV